MSRTSATEHEHDWKTVGTVDNTIGWDFVDICTVDGCDAWQKRHPKASDEVNKTKRSNPFGTTSGIQFRGTAGPDIPGNEIGDRDE